ncbi:ribbon-helix-helix domain-containing protein [Inquilinus sp. CAU 1745]|uniref:ribbon-helix-helix domain-containing protein n=1 Tax=Inquilinus sp. CAU 1745 TaxID=3140369 RepID=UPI00325B7C8A
MSKVTGANPRPMGMKSQDLPPICRNVVVAGRRTSIRMEPLMWTSVDEICAREDLTLHELCTKLDGMRGGNGLTAALRLFIVGYYRTWSAGAAADRDSAGANLKAAFRVFRPA